MKRKSFAAIFLIVLMLILSLTALVACGEEEHEFAETWSYDTEGHYHACKVEGHTDVDEKVEHTFNDGEITTAATEDATGVKTYTCTVCNYTKTEVIARLDHTHVFTDVVEVKAKCTTNGNIAYKHCTKCNKNFDADNKELSNVVILALGHDMDAGAITTASTCTNAGIKTFTCKRTGCDHKTTEAVEINPNAHNFGSWVAEVSATCTEVGTKAHKDCTYCGKHFDNEDVEITDLTIAALGHSYGEMIVEKSATCTENGNYAYYYCSVCKKYFDSAKEETTYNALIIPATSHNVAEWTETERTKVTGTTNCEYTITYSGTCSICSDSVTKTEKSSIHNFYFTVTTEPTCQSDGVKSEYCLDENCTYHTTAHATAAYKLPENADGHNWGETSTSGQYECSLCHATKTVVSSETEEISSVNVSQADEIKLSTASLSLDDGTKTALGDSSVSISAKTVNKEDVTTTSLTNEQKTQFTNAKAVYNFTITKSDTTTFSDFGEDNYITVKIPYTLSAGEDPDKIIVWCVKDDGTIESFEASYANGYVVFKTNHFSVYAVVEMTDAEYCEKNGCHNDDYIAKNPDKFIIVESTCTMGGCITCLQCETIIKTTQALGHQYMDTTLQEVSCTQYGIIEHKCSVCNTEYTTTSPAIGHNYTLIDSQDSTCAEEGFETYKCDNCSDEYTETLDKLSHDYSEKLSSNSDYHFYVCTLCGGQLEIEKHVPDYEEATKEHGITCTICGYVITEKIRNCVYYYNTVINQGDYSLTIVIKCYEDKTAEFVKSSSGNSATFSATWDYDSESRVCVTFQGEKILFVTTEGSKELTLCEEKIDSPLKYTYDYYPGIIKFYENYSLVFVMAGLVSYKGEWKDYGEFIVAEINNNGDTATLFFTKNEDGTISIIENDYSFYEYRVVITNESNKVVRTYSITFDENYQSSTKINLDNAGYISIERTYDGENYTEYTSNSVLYESGEYVVIFYVGSNSDSLEIKSTNTYVVKRSNENYYDYKLLLRDDKYYNVDCGNTEVSYKIENDIYAFDFEGNDEYLYFTLDSENQAFNVYIPTTTALYTYEDNQRYAKLYDENFIVYNDGYRTYTAKYTIEKEEYDSDKIIETINTVSSVDINTGFRINGTLVDGWQEGDAVVSIKVSNIAVGNTVFVVGEGSLEDIEIVIAYSDGTTKNLNATQVEINGTIDFNTIGNRDFLIRYDGSDWVNVSYTVGNKGDVYDRRFSDYEIVWLLDKKGDVVLDFSFIEVHEYRVGIDGYTTIKVDESYFNSEDVAKARAGKLGETFTIYANTYYDDIGSTDKLSLDVVILSQSDLDGKNPSDIVNNIQDIRIDSNKLIYSRDSKDLLDSYVSCDVEVLVTYVYEVGEDENGNIIKEEYTDCRNYIYKRNIELTDIVEGDDCDFKNTSGFYTVSLQVLGNTIENISLYSFSDKEDQIEREHYGTLLGNIPSAKVGETKDEYCTRLLSAVEGTNYFVAWGYIFEQEDAQRSVYLKCVSLYSFDETMFDFTKFDTSSAGTTEISLKVTDYNGNDFLINIEVIVE